MRKKSDRFSDVLSIVRPICDADKKDDDDLNESDKEYGFVYLMQSGKYYKIGRSNSVGRRTYELSIQLPEKLKEIHKIKTDDPVGVEAYWHKRFEGKRADGEWFQLDRQDITKFKRWKRIY